MRAKYIAPDEQFRLITQCRQGRLSDYQRCQMHTVNPGTFYNRISRLRKRGYSIPVAETERSTLTESRQEVVKRDLIPDCPASTALSFRISSTNHATLEPSSPAMELFFNNRKPKFNRFKM